jgi:centromeric protein E
MQRSDQLSGLSSSVDGGSNSGSPSCSKSSQQQNLLLDLKDGRRKSMTRKGEDPTLADSFLERTQAGDLFSAASRSRHPQPVSWIFLISTPFLFPYFPPCFHIHCACISLC